jgi:hypothetical protein
LPKKSRTAANRGQIDLPNSNKERVSALIAPARQVLNSLLEIPGYRPVGLVFRGKTG